MRALTLLILVILLVLPGVLAVPPWEQQGASFSESQLEVVVPKVEYALLNHNFHFHVHVYEPNGTLVLNDTTDCYLHTYNNTGHHVTETEMNFDSNFEEWVYIITGSDELTAYGYLPYIVWCNQTDDAIVRGGFFSGAIEINDETQVGYVDDRDATHGLSITFFILLATLIIFLLPRLYGTFTDNVIVNLVITRCCYVIGFYLMVMNAGVFASIASNSGYATSEIFRYMWLFGIGGYLLMAVTTLKTLFDVANLYQKLAKEKRGLY